MDLDVSVYNYVFPVYGGELDKNGSLDIKEIYGTAFSILNNNFITCAHTVEAALTHPVMAIGYLQKGESKALQISKHELFQLNDSAIIQTDVEIPESIALKWVKQELNMLTDVCSFGYPYGWDSLHKQILVRAFKGYISLRGRNHNYSKSPHYELSFQVPRGLSGGPVLHANNICGMASGNEITEMVVFSQKELENDGKIEKHYFKTEALHTGIAMQTSSFLKLDSKLLGGDFETYLNKVGLMSGK